MTKKPRKILIIKTGYTETLCDEPYKEGKVSLGDVLRTTALLHLYREDKVTWLTDKKAIPLLTGNCFIERILEFTLTTVLQLTYEHFDVVINLEKNPGLCALASAIESWQKYGFRFDAHTGKAEAYTGAIEALYMAKDERSKKQDNNHWLHHLFAMVGHLWSNEGYLMGDLGVGSDKEYKHRLVGINWRVGNKFEGKSWNMDNWAVLTGLLQTEGMTWSVQPDETTLEDYARWIAAHTVIVSCDSLGLHMAMSMGKRIVGLFGSTEAKEIQPYEQGIMLQAMGKLIIGTEEKGVWEIETEDIAPSMDEHTPERVLESIKTLLNWGVS